MNCNKVQTLLSAYADRELSGIEMFLIRQHVYDCDCCRAEEAEVRRVKSVLASIEVAEPSPDFESRLVSAVMGARPEPAEERRLRSATGFAVTSLAAAAAICVFFSVRANTSSPHQAATVNRRSTPTLVSPPAGPTMAAAMHRDSAFMNSADPLSGPPGAIAASYAGR
ncbi:MAG TPA: zf-HC2 domain-containing protein [Fimbriimonadaceae bacterium]|nr:zf-HC2 domain-containing protein [Fimbriimonadaceae bacterium]